MISSLRARLSPPHDQVWTYWDLPLDLGANPDPARRELWNGILRALNLPKGSVVFWPMSETRGPIVSARPDLLLSILGEIRPRVVVCFGRPAFESLFPDRQFDLNSFTWDGLLVQPLPGPEDMLPDQRDVKHVVWKKLQNLSRVPPNSPS